MKSNIHAQIKLSAVTSTKVFKWPDYFYKYLCDTFFSLILFFDSLLDDVLFC